MVSQSLLDADELSALAYSDFARGDLSGALTKLKTLGDGELPESEPQLALAGRIYAQLGLYDRAKACFQAVLDEHPAAADERFELGLTLHQAGNPQDAYREWSTVLDQSPNHEATLFFMALYHVDSGDRDTAIGYLEKLLSTAPPDGAFCKRASELLEQLRAPSVLPQAYSESDPILSSSSI